MPSDEIVVEQAKAADFALYLGSIIQDAGGKPNIDCSDKAWFAYCGHGSMPKHISNARQWGLECGMSLAQALSDAGGTVYPAILDMTLRDFISQAAAQNHIRFEYKKPCKSSD